MLFFFLAAQLFEPGLLGTLLFVEARELLALRRLAAARLVELLGRLAQQRHVGVLGALLHDLRRDVRELLLLRGLDQRRQDRLRGLDPADRLGKLGGPALVVGQVVQHLQRLLCHHCAVIRNLTALDLCSGGGTPVALREHLACRV